MNNLCWVLDNVDTDDNNRAEKRITRHFSCSDFEFSRFNCKTIRM